MKKIFGALILAVTLALIGCVSTESEFTNFYPRFARNVANTYDIQIVSNKNTISKVYKLQSKETSEVFYSVSEPSSWNANEDIDVRELEHFALITEENAKALVSFIGQLESAYSKTERDKSGVLYDFQVLRRNRYQAWTTDSITTRSGYESTSRNSTSTSSSSDVVGRSSGYESTSVSGSEVTQSLKEFEADDILIRIQLKTEENEDFIVFAVNDYSETVDLEDLQTLKTALSR